MRAPFQNRWHRTPPNADPVPHGSPDLALQNTASSFVDRSSLRLQFDKRLNALAEPECTTRQVALFLRSPQTLHRVEASNSCADRAEAWGQTGRSPDFAALEIEVSPVCPRF